MKRGFRMSKYKVIIKNIYPSSSEGEMQVHNVTKLVHFCEISPQKILKVSKFIERKAKKDLSKSKIKFVIIAMRIYQELIKGCRKNLNLFASNVLTFIRTSLEGNYPELKIHATETFIRFAEVLDETSQYHELEVLVNHFFNMCQFEQGDMALKIRVREEGLRGIRAYMGILDMTDELDAFVTKHTDQEKTRFVPIILENVTFGAVVAGAANGQNSVQTLATEVLRDVFTRANISVTSLFRAILGFLDSRNRWVPNTFAMTCFKAFYGVLKPQHEQILMTLFLQHLDLNRPASIKKQIVAILVELFRESTGHFMQILDALTRHLVASVEIVSQDIRARDYEDHIELQEAIVNAVGTLNKKVAGNQRLEGFNWICEKLSSSKHILPTGLSGAALYILRLAYELKMERIDPDWISVTSMDLLKDLAVHPHHEIRILVHKISHSLLLGGKSLEYYLNNKGTRASTVVEANDKLITMIGEVIRDTLPEQIKIKHNQPENYAMIFHSLNLLLHLANRKDFFLAYPILFAIQKSGAKWKKIPVQCANTINTVIAGYLYASAQFFDCAPLATYVDEIVEKRKQVNQLCPHMEIVRKPTFVTIVVNPLKDKYPEDLKKKVPAEYIWFDRDIITDLLCNTESCVLRNEPRIRRILGKKLHRNTRGTLREASEVPLEPEPEHFLPTLVPTIIHSTKNNETDNTNNKERGVGGVAVVVDGAVGAPITVLGPEVITPSKARVPLTFSDLKRCTENGLPVPPLEIFPVKQFDIAAQRCFKAEQSKAVTLNVVAKLVDFDFDSYCRYRGSENVADGATEFPLVSSTMLYNPPSCTLTMNFSCDGQFFVLNDM